MMQKHHEDFERMALRIAGDDISGYHALMSMPMADYARAAEAWMDRIVKAQEQAKKAKRK